MYQMENVKIERDTLQVRVDELLSGGTSALEALVALGAEKEALSAQLEEAISQLKAKDEELSGLAGKVESLLNDLSALKSEKVRGHVKDETQLELERPEIKMENDWKKTRPRKSLRKLVGRCLSFRFN
jgi:seryl-tRNA synthetase